MRFNDNCAKCMYDRQVKKTNNQEYLAEIKKVLDNRPDDITSPQIVDAFNRLHEKYLGPLPSFSKEKEEYNDLVLSMENDLRNEIETSEDPLATAIVMSRIGNYIDFGALNKVDKGTFLGLFSDTKLREDEKVVYESFCRKCSAAEGFLLLTDNCGEIVLDKLMIEQLHKRFPKMSVTVMVRGGDILNDATLEDAKYVGIDAVAEVISNGKRLAGTVYGELSNEAKKAVDEADVVLSKGQANYESFAGEGRHAFYLLLCKCDLFINRFKVPRLTGMFVEE
ncbi:MAG: ARMT1-like domain-containing protein [Lachnospiraceae bacterium]|nr:ARMT1-like domain-containing protein [Lachnospiraceae bacterium]